MRRPDVSSHLQFGYTLQAYRMYHQAAGQCCQAHYCPPPSVTAQRFTFNSWTQREEETLAKFVAQLRQLSEHCDFAVSLDMLLERLVCGVRDSCLQKCLLAEPELTFQKAFDLCQVSEVADKNVKELQVGQQQGSMLPGASVMVIHGGAPPAYHH